MLNKIKSTRAGLHGVGPLYRSFLGVVGILVFAFVMLAGDITSFGVSNKAFAAGEQPWRVVVAVGEVRARPLESTASTPWRTITAGDQVSVGSELKTNDGSHALLANDRDTITVQEGSRIALPKPAEKGMTLVLQESGDAFYQVESRKVAAADPGDTLYNTVAASPSRFEVRTRYLVAVVKGTAFGVSVDGDGARVNVREGTVGVKNSSSGRSVDIGVGRMAAVAASGGPSIDVRPTPAGQGVRGIDLKTVPGQIRSIEVKAAPATDKENVPGLQKSDFTNTNASINATTRGSSAKSSSSSSRSSSSSSKSKSSSSRSSSSSSRSSSSSSKSSSSSSSSSSSKGKSSSSKGKSKSRGNSGGGQE